MDKANTSRVLAIALTARGFGYAVLEGRGSLVAYGATSITGDRNSGSLARIEKMIIRYRPDVLTLYDVNAKGIYRHRRIKELHRKVLRLAKKQRVATKTFSAIDLREAILRNSKGTKYEIAEFLARRFPEELAPRLPPKRKEWNSEDRRMDIFDAVALAMVSTMP